MSVQQFHERSGRVVLPGVQSWLTAPERNYRDLAAPNLNSSEADKLRELILHVGLTSLAAQGQQNLLLPPDKPSNAKVCDDRKDLHHNRYVEVGIVTRGEMTLWWDGTFVQLPAGSVFVIPPGMRYLPHARARGVEQQVHSVVWLALHRGCAVVHECMLRGDTHQLSEYYSFVDPQITNQSRVISQELAERSPHYATVIRGSLFCLLTWLLRAPVQRISMLGGATKEIRVDGQDSFSDRVKSYLLSHYHRPISLNQVAKAIGCSPAHLCRHFRELAGETPFQYLRGVRIEAAKRLLGSQVPIARVAEMVGFDDPLYFSKVFSSCTGESPQSYRMRNHPVRGAA